MIDMSKAKSFSSSRKFGAKPELLQEILVPDFYPWEYVIFYDDVVQFCDFFGADDKFNLEIPALCDPMKSYAEGSLENMPDYV